MQTTLENYKLFLFDCGLSENTIDSYLFDIGIFNSYLNNNNIKRATEKTINDYIKYLDNLNVSTSTINRRVASIKKYYAYLLSHNIISINPALKIKSKKANERTPDILTKDEIVNFLSNIEGDKTKTKRDRVILEFLYATGVKVTEIIELELNNINFELGLLTVNTGIKKRLVPLSDTLVAILKNYVENIRPLIDKKNSNKLFLNMNGSMLSRQGIWKTINYYSEKSKIEKTISTNTFRHSIAVHMLENGAEPKYVKEILGFEDNSSVRFYMQYIKETRRDRYLKYYQ